MDFLRDDWWEGVRRIRDMSWCGSEIISCWRSEVEDGYEILGRSCGSGKRLVELIWM